MTANAGYHTFATGDVLTAAQVQYNLQNQVVMYFADATARTTALTGVLVEGMVSYLASTKVVEIYTGAAWVSLDDPNAIQNSLVTAKGNIIAASAASTPAALAVGTDGQVLTASSGAATGLAWASASNGSSQVAGKNLIINGDFYINQRAFTSNTTSIYNYDRWLQTVAGGGSTTITPQSFTPGTAPLATYEGRTYLQAVTASQSAVGDYGFIQQRIEGVNTQAGNTVTVSFYAKAAAGTPKMAVAFQQNFGAGGSPSATVDVPGGSVTLSTSWARYSVSVAIPSISGKTIGTTANSSYLSLLLFFSAGSTWNTLASSIGNQNGTFSVWGVQVEYASAATYFTTATNTTAGELAACQRYYWKNTLIDTYGCLGIGSAKDGVSVNVPIVLPQQMRVTPTSVDYATPLGLYDGVTINTVSSLTLVSSQSTANLAMLFPISTSMTAFRPYFLIKNSSTTAYIALNAEL